MKRLGHPVLHLPANVAGMVDETFRTPRCFMVELYMLHNVSLIGVVNSEYYLGQA